MTPHMPYPQLRLEKRWVLSDNRARSVIKTLTWRVTGSFATFLIAWSIGGDMAVAGSIAVVQIVANTMLYYLHERLWNLIGWGRNS